MKFSFYIVVLLCVFIGMASFVRAQVAVPPPMPAYQPLADAQLDQLLGPIALYPDPLIAQILPASTMPTQIVLADRYVTGGGDPNQIDQQPWDPSVQALARYPSVLKWMDDNLNWTTELGQTFLNQQPDVMNSIQRLRASANNLGNLQSTPQQQVVNDGGNIEIVPADPQVIYVPVYQPDLVYYQTGYGSPFITFGIGFAIGGWLDCDFDWGHRDIIYWGHDHPRPSNWWHEPPRQRNYNQATVWHSNNHQGSVGVYHGDRGYGTTYNRPVTAPAGRPGFNSAEPRQPLPPASRPNEPATRPSMPVARPAPAPVQHTQPVSRSEPNSAFIGIQSSHDTKTYSNRGQQSLQPTTRSAPAPQAAPVSRPPPAAPSGGGGGGGGGNNSNSKKDH
jgi:Protein of unknown function (DUF3300)